MTRGLLKWATDLTVCPDCNKKQRLPKRYLDECENTSCESYITHSKSHVLYWWNPNWG